MTFKTGDKVAVVFRGGWDGPEVRGFDTVTEVMKTKVKLAGGRAFMPSGRGEYGKSGGSYYELLELETPEHHALIEQAKQRRIFNDIQDRFSRLRPKNLEPEQVAAINAAMVPVMALLEKKESRDNGR